jgi:hypothetical protein
MTDDGFDMADDSHFAFTEEVRVGGGGLEIIPPHRGVPLELPVDPLQVSRGLELGGSCRDRLIQALPMVEIGADAVEECLVAFVGHGTPYLGDRRSGIHRRSVNVNTIEIQSIWCHVRCMGRDDKDGKTSVTGGILRAVGTGMLIVGLAFAAKAVFGAAGMAMDHLLTAAFAGVAGTMSMVGAAAADRECRESEAVKLARPCQVAGTVSQASPDLMVGVAEIGASERCERRFAARLEGQRGQGAGRGY